MRKNVIYFLSIIVTVGALLGACGQKAPGPGDDSGNIVKLILVTPKLEPDFAVGETCSLEVIGYTMAGDAHRITPSAFHSSNPAVAKAETGGAFIALSSGQTEIHAELNGVKSQALIIEVK